MNIAQIKMVRTEIRIVHFELVGSDVIRKYDFPPVLLKGKAYQPNPGEKLRGPEGRVATRLSADGASGHG